MRKIVELLMLVLLSGCANFDSGAFQRNLAEAYAFNQATTQRQVDALNAQAFRNVATAHNLINDFDWEWDQFYNSSYQLVWACRGVQSGQFADASRCAYKPQTDLRWPEK
nr:hypothetical protein [Massilia sp. PDC64]